MRRLALLSLLVLGSLALAASPALAANGKRKAAHGGGTTTWQVTIENLAPPGSGAPGAQPLSPPLVVVHAPWADVWSVGDYASRGVAAIAQDADNAVLETILPGMRGIRSVATVAGGPIPSGASRTFTVETHGLARHLSLVSMLVNTNDGFTGLDSLPLHGRHTVLTVRAYDAGAERNNQLAASIPGPCCGHPFVGDPEIAPIAPHPGIVDGVGDLTSALFGWAEPVARITIDRIG